MAPNVNNNVAYSGIFIQSPEHRQRALAQEGIQESASVKNKARVDLEQDIGVQTVNVEPIERSQAQEGFATQDATQSYDQSKIYENAKNYFDGLKNSAAQLGKAAAYVQTANQGNRQAAQDMLGFETYA